MELLVHDGPGEVASTVAGIVAAQIEAKAGPFSLSLAGASTPQPAYGLLREAEVSWEEVTAWLGDERWVAPDSDRSNGRMVTDILFAHVPARLIRPEWGPDLDPHDSAARYEAELDALESESNGHDLVLLGLGDDGHTASLFPGSSALAETERRYVATQIPETGEPRITATYPLLRRARLVLFMVVGQSKAAALRSSLAGDTPAGRVELDDGVIEWHVDRAAASLLS